MTALVSLAATAVAVATTKTSADIGYAAGARVVSTPSSSTGLSLKLASSDSAQDKPDPLTRIVLRFAKGTNVDTRTRARCTAASGEFVSKGEAACPAKSRVGTGTAQLITGIGPQSSGGPDPVDAKVTAFNAKAGMLVYVRPDVGEAFVIKGSMSGDGRTGPTVTPVLTLKIPPDEVPGFGNAAISSLTLALVPYSAKVAGKRRTYLRTPPVCPAAKHWPLSATFGYEHQSADTTSQFSSCRRK